MFDFANWDAAVFGDHSRLTGLLCAMCLRSNWFETCEMIRETMADLFAAAVEFMNMSCFMCHDPKEN